jgi:nitroreductase
MQKEILMNETMKTIYNLRSTHGNFSEREVSDDDLLTLLDACVRAANASARQSYAIIAIHDKERIRELCGYTGSKALFFCVDYNRIMDTAAYLGHEYIANSIHDFITGSTDTILAAQTAAICARSLGIDSLFTNGIQRGDMARVYKLLDLPEQGCFPLIMLVLGYADKEPAYQKGRLTGKGVIHHDRYQRLSQDELKELVAEYDDPEKKLGMIQDWQKLGFEHYQDWFFEKWIGVGGDHPDKSQMLELLETAGLLEW